MARTKQSARKTVNSVGQKEVMKKSERARTAGKTPVKIKEEPGTPRATVGAKKLTKRPAIKKAPSQPVKPKRRVRRGVVALRWVRVCTCLAAYMHHEIGDMQCTDAPNAFGPTRMLRQMKLRAGHAQHGT